MAVKSVGAKITPESQLRSLPFESWLNASRTTRPDPRRSPSVLPRDLLAVERAVRHCGPRLPAAQSLWPAAQLDR